MIKRYSVVGKTQSKGDSCVKPYLVSENLMRILGQILRRISKSHSIPGISESGYLVAGSNNTEDLEDAAWFIEKNPQSWWTKLMKIAKTVGKTSSKHVTLPEGQPVALLWTWISRPRAASFPGH